MSEKINAEGQSEAFEKMAEDDDEKKDRLGEKTIVEEMAEQANEAFKRSRNSLVILFLASLVLLVGFFDHRGTWLYTQDFAATENINKKLKEPIDPAVYASPNDALVDAINRQSENDKPEYKRHLLHDVWDGNFKTVEVPALGIEFYVEDLPLVGAFAIFIILSWFYVYMRRSKGISRAIYLKVKDAEKKKEKFVVEYLFNSLALNQVFITIKGIDDSDEEIETDGNSFSTKDKLAALGTCLGILAVIIATVLFHESRIFYLIIVSLVFSLLFSCIIFHKAFINIVEIFEQIKKSILSKTGKKTEHKFSQIFFRFGLLFPVIVLATVLSHDIYETYFWESRGIYLPNKSLIEMSKSISVYTLEKNGYLPILPKDERNLEYDETTKAIAYYEYHYKTHFDTAYRIKLAEIDSPSEKKPTPNNGATISQHSISINKEKEEQLRNYEFQIDSLHDQFFHPATIYQDICARDLYYKRMNTKMFRIGGFVHHYSIQFEVIVLRTIVPTVLIFICFMMTMSILYVNKLTQDYFEEMEKIKKNI